MYVLRHHFMNISVDVDIFGFWDMMQTIERMTFYVSNCNLADAETAEKRDKVRAPLHFFEGGGSPKILFLKVTQRVMELI